MERNCSIFLVKDFKKNRGMSWKTVVLIVWEKAFYPAYCFDTENYP